MEKRKWFAETGCAVACSPVACPLALLRCERSESSPEIAVGCRNELRVSRKAEKLEAERAENDLWV